MSGAHTPGPWELHEIGKSKMPVAVITRRNGGTASVLYPPQTPTTQTPFDMRLAAAAPDMLAALISLVDCFEKHRPKEHWDAARAAITKATGASA